MHKAKPGKRRRTKRGSLKGIAATFLCVLAALCGLLAACSAAESGTEPRGSIVSADGVVLAESAEGSGARVYPEGASISAVVGSCYTEGAPDGIEQRYESNLLDGEDVELTVDMQVQKAAMDALGDCSGAIVVMNPQNGAVVAMASTPAYDPSASSVDGQASVNRATELHIPGSTFKTITLAAALESGAAGGGTRFPAPAQLDFADGVVSNYGAVYDSALTLEQAYAQSVNTVFAQIALQVRVDRIEAMAGNFGFGQQIMDDFPLETSDVLNMEGSSELVQAWAGVGQALYGDDGVLRGPVMTCVQGTLIAATIANGGTVYQPYIVSKVGERQSDCAEEPVVLSERFLSPGTVDYIAECMRAVVEEGTGKSAAVPGVDVRGKTGTAETASGEDDGWFIGYACPRGGSGNGSGSSADCYAFAVLVQGESSSNAAEIANRLLASLF